MTTPEAVEAPEAMAKITPNYWIDPDRFQEIGRSMEVVLLNRRCRSCKEKQADVAEPPPTKQQIKHIVGCCAKDETFIRPGMPMQEIMFRLLLAKGNKPMSLDELHFQLTEQYATPGNPMAISKQALMRVLDNDDFYGFHAMPTEKAE